MTEEIDAVPEGFAPRLEPQAPEVVETPSETQEAPAHDDKELNFRRLREEKERLQLDYEQTQIKLKAYEEYVKNNSTPTQQYQQPEPVEEEEPYDPTDWVTNEQLDKRVEKRAFEAAKRLLEKERKEELARTMPHRIRQACPDIDTVMTRENVKKLRDTNPELAEILYNMENEEKKTIATYNYCKMMQPASDPAVVEAERKMAENDKLPKSPSSVAGISPLTHAADFENGRLTPAMRKQLYEETLKLARG